MKALILAGGSGTRLRSEIDDVPKPMAPVAGKPFLEWQIEQLRDNGITDIVLSVGFKAEVIRHHFGTGRGFDVDIEYVREKEPLGTGGAVVKAKENLLGDDGFLVINGDTYLELDFDSFIDFHKSNEAIGTLALSRIQERKSGGYVDLEGPRITNFVEDERDDGLVNAGIHLFEPSIFDRMPDRKRFQLTDVLVDLTTAGDLYGFVTEGYFKDIGTPESYREINRELPMIV